MLDKTTEAEIFEIDFLICVLEQYLDEYEQATSAKTKHAVLADLFSVSKQISHYFQQPNSKYHLMNEIKSKSIEIFDHQIAFRTKEL